MSFLKTLSANSRSFSRHRQGNSQGLRVFQELKEAESWVNVQVQAHEGAEAVILKLGMPVEQL